MTEKSIKKVGLGTAILIASGSALAEGGIGDSAAAAIGGSQADLTTVGGAIILAVAGIWVIKRIVGLIR